MFIKKVNDNKIKECIIEQITCFWNQEWAEVFIKKVKDYKIQECTREEYPRSPKNGKNGQVGNFENK